MCDRLQIPDDSRNKVNKTANSVSLSKPFQKKIENGYYLSKLLIDMYTTFSQRSGKQFNYTKIREINPDNPGFNETDWKNIFETLNFYGLELPQSKQETIIKAKNIQVVLDLFDALNEIDNNPTCQISNSTKRKLEITKMFGKGYQFVTPEKQITSNRQGGLDNSRLSVQFQDKKALLPNSMSARRGSSKLNPLEITSPKASNILQQLEQQTGRLLLGKESTLFGAEELVDDMIPVSLAACRTSVQFIIMSISIAFDLKPKQATALLANRNQILIHLCIKGGKGSDFGQVLNWYSLISNNADILVSLISSEKIDLMSFGTPVPVMSKGPQVKQNRRKILIKTLNILKNGFYSLNNDVKISCCLCFQNILKAANIGQQSDSPKKDKKKKEEKSKDNQQMNRETPKIEKQKSIGILKIQVVEAKLTKDTEWLGKMDPFVMLKFGGQEWKTNTIQEGGQDPKWIDQIWTCDVKQIDGHLEIKVIEEDITSNELVGQAQVQISKFTHLTNFDNWIDIIYNEKVTGKVHLKTIWTPQAAGSSVLKNNQKVTQAEEIDKSKDKSKFENKGKNNGKDKKKNENSSSSSSSSSEDEKKKSNNVANLEFISDQWEWLTSQTIQPELKKNLKRPSPQEIASEFDFYQYQTGLQAIVFAMQSNDDLPASQLLLMFAQHNPIELFTQHLLYKSPQWSFYAIICNDIFRQTVNQQIFNKVIEQSGVLKFWIQNSLQVADQNNGVTLNDRILSLIFTSELWRTKTLIFEQTVPNASEQIIKVMKSAARDKKRTLVVISIELMFRLLEQFQTNKHSFAAQLYKTLSFLLVEFYWEVDVREEMLRHFMCYYQQKESQPIEILLEPLLKQIEISQYRIASFNTFDFEFFQSIMQKQMPISTKLLLIETFTKIAITSVYYQAQAIKLIKIIMQKLGFQQQVKEYWLQSSRQILQSIGMIQSRFVMHQIQVQNEEKNFYSKLALKSKTGREQNKMSETEFHQTRINERLVVNILSMLQNLKNDQVNEALRIQLIDLYISIERQLQVKSKSVKYLLKFYTKQVDQMIDDRTDPIIVPIPYMNEIQQVIEAGQLLAPGAVNLYSSISKKKTIPKQTLTIQPQPTQKKETELYYYNEWEEQSDINLYQQFQKRHSRFYQQLIRSYLNVAKKPQAIEKPTFEERQIELISSQSLYKMIKDFNLENGQQNIILKEEINKLVKTININIMERSGDVTELTVEGFEHFMLQYAYIIYSNSVKQPKSYLLVEQLFNHMKIQPKFNQLGLTMAKTETTARKDVDLMAKLLKHNEIAGVLRIQVVEAKLTNDTEMIGKMDNFVILKYKGQEWKTSVIQEGGKNPKWTNQNWACDVKDIGDELEIIVMDQDVMTCDLVGSTKAKISTFTRESNFDNWISIDYNNQVAGTVHLKTLWTPNQPFDLPLNHKLVEEKVSQFQYIVPPQLPMATHKKICMELMDEIIFSLTGQHFLEPIATERIIFKVLPQLQSIRQTNHVIQNPIINPQPLPAKGRPSNQPISHSVALSLEQEHAKKRFEDKFEKKGKMLDTYTSSNYTIDQKLQFKAQAVNRRAELLGETIQLSIINSPMQDKQLMFECGEVLNEILKAVEVGKKALRLDYTPYRLYDMYKKKLPQPQPISEQEEEVNEEEAKRKKEQCLHHIDNAKMYLQQQKEKQKKDKKNIQMENEKLERLKLLKAEEYKQVQQSILQDSEKNKKELMIQKQQDDKRKQHQISTMKEKAKQAVQQTVNLYKSELKQKEEEYKDKFESQISIEQQKSDFVKSFANKSLIIHKNKLQKVGQIKNQAMETFYNWVKTAQIQKLVNKKFKHGLYLKFDQCLKIGQTNSGVTQQAWMGWLKQCGMLQLVDPKQLIRIHSVQVKEMQEMPDYNVFFECQLKSAPHQGDTELSYGAFVAALIKVANLQTLVQQDNQGKPFSQIVYKEYGEYQIPDQAGTAFKNLMYQLNVAGSSKPKAQSEPKQDYLVSKTPQNEEKTSSPNEEKRSQTKEEKRSPKNEERDSRSDLKEEKAPKSPRLRKKVNFQGKDSKNLKDVVLEKQDGGGCVIF